MQKFTCFVCANEFTEYKEFKYHIIQEHEKGREYLSCPYCDAPVRCMRTHYKCKHPGVPLPQGIQLKAIAWYDFDNKKKRKKKKMSFNEGYMVSLKNHGAVMHYRSGWELEIYQYLEFINEVIGYEVEPADCVCPYYYQGKMKKYFPDLKVRFADGHIEIWEIKPANQTSWEINQAKWDACKAMCEIRGYKFKIINEQEMNRLRILVNENVKSEN